MYEKVILEFFTDLAGFEIGEVTGKTLMEDLGLDEIDREEAITGVEDETGVTIQGSEWETFVTVGDVINHVNRNLYDCAVDGSGDCV